MKNLPQKIKRLCLIFVAAVPLVSHAVEAESALKTYVLTPPISVSQYSRKYVEDPLGQTTRTITVHGQERSYQVYTPSSNSDQPRQVLILLHGAQRSGVSLVEKWKDIAERYNVILIGPNGLNNGWNMQTDGPMFLSAVLLDVRATHKIDTTRVYLFGHSLGASFSLYISAIYSKVFAATALHAGQFGAPADYEFIDRAQRKIPVGFFIGTQDALFSLEKVRQSAQAFASRGHATALYVLNGHNHWYYDLAPFINQQAWEFLSQYKLGQP